MIDFDYVKAQDVSDAVNQIARNPAAKFIAGGTNLIDLMKENVAHPSRLIDITGLPLTEIEDTKAGGLRIGALVPNSDLAYDERITKRYPLVSSASEHPPSSATWPRPEAIIQRTRCLYFDDTNTACNKREPGSSCDAIGGFNRMNAILGWSETCIAVHPSDLCVALAALEAIVHVSGSKGDRAIPFADFHRLAIANASRFEDYQEPTVPWSGALYHCKNAAVSAKLARVDLFTPCDMRAPGGAVGVYAIECAMDELSYAVGIDPLELRLKNYSEMDQNEDKPFTSKALKECYQQGAERFGWSKRKPEPRSMREGRELVGYGMATGIGRHFVCRRARERRLLPTARSKLVPPRPMSAPGLTPSLLRSAPRCSACRWTRSKSRSAIQTYR